MVLFDESALATLEVLDLVRRECGLRLANERKFDHIFVEGVIAILTLPGVVWVCIRLSSRKKKLSRKSGPDRIRNERNTAFEVVEASQAPTARHYTGGRFVLR